MALFGGFWVSARTGNYNELKFAPNRSGKSQNFWTTSARDRPYHLPRERKGSCFFAISPNRSEFCLTFWDLHSWIFLVSDALNAMHYFNWRKSWKLFNKLNVISSGIVAKPLTDKASDDYEHIDTLKSLLSVGKYPINSNSFQVSVQVAWAFLFFF